MPFEFAANNLLAFREINSKFYNIFACDKAVLKDFVDEVEFRLTYQLRFDHEIHLLKKPYRVIQVSQ